MVKNVKIPFPLLSQLIDLLEYWNVSAYDPAVQYEYEAVYSALLKKRHGCDLRDAYSNMVFAKDDDARHEARIHYLQKKRFIDDF